MTSEQQARERIDELLEAAGWTVRDPANASIHAARGVAIREFPLKSGHGIADYLLYVDGAAAGVIEAKKEGVTLSGVETQAARHTQGLPDGLPAWRHPLPFAFQSTGVEARSTNGLGPQPRALPGFTFHRPEHLARSLNTGGSGFSPTNPQTASIPTPAMVADAQGEYAATPVTTLMWRMRGIPPLVEGSEGTLKQFRKNAEDVDGSSTASAVV